MHGHDLGLSVEENYRVFAQGARGRSPIYESLSGSVAEDTAIFSPRSIIPATTPQRATLTSAVSRTGTRSARKTSSALALFWMAHCDRQGSGCTANSATTGRAAACGGGTATS